MMSKWSKLSRLVACLAVFVGNGCVMTPCGKTPAVVCPERIPVGAPLVIRARNLAFRAPGAMECAWPRMKAEAEDVDAGAFRRAAARMGVVPANDVVDATLRPHARIFLTVECQYRKNWSLDLVRALSLTLIPCPRHHDWIYDFSVRSESGQTAQYHFEDGWNEYAGLVALALLPCGETSEDEVADSVLENVYLSLFTAMARDGFFNPTPKREPPTELGGGTEKRTSAPAVPETSDGGGTASADRQKELEDFKAAGVISEEEYRREVEKMKKEEK